MACGSEEALRDPVRHWLVAQGFTVRDEVRFNGRVADLVGVRGDDVVAVELKLRDWKGAHVQAKAYQVGAPRTFVALPLARALKVHPAKTSRFEDSGVGLLGVDVDDASVRVLVEADPSDRTLPFLAEGLRTRRVGRSRSTRR